MPDQDADFLTPATRLLEKKREMAEVEEALVATKEEFQMKMEGLQQRREELERKEQQLKESLLKFDKFLKENDMKRARAMKKTKDEQEGIRTKNTEIDRLKEELSRLQSYAEKQKRKLKKQAMFKEFLEKVLEQSPEFDEISEILARYKTLHATMEDLMEQDQVNQDAIDREKAGMVQVVEQRNNEILTYNNQLADLQGRLETAQAAAVKWESEWTRIQTTAAKKTLELGQIKMATHNLFVLVNKHLQRKIPPSEADQTLLQLDKIQTFIKDLTEITHEIQRNESAQLPNMQLLGLT
jgi:chromosome segregation ATPase